MALKGKATIQLFDGKTGEIVNEIHEENMITNAVSTIINPPDFIEFGVDNTLNNRSNNFLKIFKNDLINGAFGGVIVCRDKIEENADNMMLPPTNEEIGHAGMTTTNADIKTGTYNTNESGRIENGKGYRHVWDFGTDKANGVINCVCLTTRDGGSNGYNCAYPDMNMGGIDLTSNSTSFVNNMYYPISRESNVEFVTDNYKWFFIGRKPNGNVRMLGKCITDHAIYEAEIYDPNAISIRTDKPFCDFIKCEKIIELFDAPSVPPNTSESAKYFYGEPFPSSANEEQAREAWEENPPWFAYCPYVTGDEIHIVGTSLQHILHYVYDLNTYKQKSVRKIKTDTPLCEFNLSYKYLRSSNSGGNYYMTRIPSERAWEEMSAFFWDDKYFAIPKNPLVDGVRRTEIQNLHQLEIFTTEGVSIKQTIDGLGSSYFNSQYWDGFYFDDTTKTPLVSIYQPNSSKNIVYDFLITKTADSYSSYNIHRGIPNRSMSFHFGNIPKIEGMSLPLYASIYANHSSSSKNTLLLGVGVMKLCLTTINNLSEPVRKLEGQAMKITYDIVEEDEV